MSEQIFSENDHFSAPVGQNAVQYPIVGLGATVTYLSSHGSPKLGLVIGTPESIKEGTDVPSLIPGQVHLMVFSPNGNVGPRFTVPHRALAETLPDFDPNANVWF